MVTHQLKSGSTSLLAFISPSSRFVSQPGAWAIRNVPKKEVDRLLGYLNGQKSAIAAVEILDAFPTKPCLSVDIANPQWKWDNSVVKYGPEPHQMLSLERPTIKIGLRHTTCGTLQDVLEGMEWLKNALLSEGLGSRVSAGYGWANKLNGSFVPFSRNASPRSLSQEYPFECWSQGVYGAKPDQPELRPVAIRGVLRYWFRAVALGLYSPTVCKELEADFFGTLEPKARKGAIQVVVNDQTQQEDLQRTPYVIRGTIRIEASQERQLVLVEKLLKLASHLGGFGRGSRRSLHWNSGRLRGCYWQLIGDQATLRCNQEDWRSFLRSLREDFFQLRQPDRPSNGDPGSTTMRYQDVLNRNARIYLVQDPRLKHPDQVQNWQKEGNQPTVRGAGLEFFYRSGYKGLSRQPQDNNSNAQVGGKLGIPSFVWITSNCLHLPKEAYQVITLFGVDQEHREEFDRLVRQQQVITVWDGTDL